MKSKQHFKVFEGKELVECFLAIDHKDAIEQMARSLGYQNIDQMLRDRTTVFYTVPFDPRELN